MIIIIINFLLRKKPGTSFVSRGRSSLSTIGSPEVFFFRRPDQLAALAQGSSLRSQPPARCARPRQFAPLTTPCSPKVGRCAHNPQLAALAQGSSLRSQPPARCARPRQLAPLATPQLAALAQGSPLATPSARCARPRQLAPLATPQLAALAQSSSLRSQHPSSLRSPKAARSARYPPARCARPRQLTPFATPSSLRSPKVFYLAVKTVVFFNGEKLPPQTTSPRLH